MSTAENRSTFVRRFDRIWAQARRVQLSQAICWAVLIALAGIALLAAVDYWFELSQPLRLAAVVVIGLGSLVAAVLLASQSVRRWQRNATAAAIEQVFPQLGQRIRTTVQYGELSSTQIEESGVATTLVDALESDTVRLAQPLPLDAVVPWKSLALVSLLAAVVGLLLAGASAFDWQWRAAAKRAFLSDEPYTRIEVVPGNVSVREGESVLVKVKVEGRTGKHVTFWSRRADEEGSEWGEEHLSAIPTSQAKERELAFEAPLDRVRHPLEYRVTAGTEQSKIYRVDVLYPLKIVKLQAAIVSPEYTGLPETTIEGGNITALVGSKVKLTIELDRAPETATLEMQSIGGRRGKESEPAVEQLPLTIDGAKLTTEFELTTDKTFAVVAKSADGMELPENKHRVRARQDEPPQVWFENPPEAMETHTLAEILMRIRVSDDFGLSRAGVMFEVNNEEEYPLLAQDFLAAAEELKETGKLSPQTRATLEKVLPLEHFELTQQDSVMYYAFAEDIRPGSAQRTETDLRFIDIRPFRRLYRVLPSADGMPNMNQGPQLKTLEEIIARQRYALNRTIQLSRKFARSGQADLSGIDSLIKFEAELAKSTRELAEGLIARGIDETELLFQAEASMLAATDSLSAGKYDTATLQMRDALKSLIEGRDRLRINLMKNRDRQQLAQLRQFDRLQQQKLRRPKSDEEEAKEIAQRLQELADREDFVYQALAQILDPDAASKSNDSASAAGAIGEPKKPGEKKDPGESPMPETKPGEKPADGEKPAKGNEGEKPAEGDKPVDGQPAKLAGPSQQELEDRQLDVSLDAREVEKALAKLPKATDLAKERMATAAKSAEDAAAALGKGGTKEAREAAKEAAGAAKAQFRELVEQVKALLAQEQADRIAAAQQMAANLARQQEDFADRLASEGEQKGLTGNKPPKEPKEDDKTPGAGKQEEKRRQERMEGLGKGAEQIAEKAKTLADVLGAAAKADNPEDQDSAKKVEELVGKLDLKGLAERLGNLPDQVKNKKFEDAKATAGDGAERMEAAAEQLSALHRAVVAPRVDELAKLDEKLTVLDDQLDELNTDSRVTGWHQEASELLDELDKAGVDKELRNEFQEEMRKAGWGGDLRGGWKWARTEGGYYAAPAPYKVSLSRLSDSVRTRMQELMLGDLRSTGDEPIPPQYQDLVDRYHKVLTTEGKAMTKPRSGNPKAR